MNEAKSEQAAFRVGGAFWMNFPPGELTLRDGQWVPVEEAKEDNKVSVAEIFKRGLRGATVILNGEVGTAADAAMIARDGPAKPAVVAIPAAPKPPAKPAPSGLTLSPDLRATSHLVEPVHGSAALAKHA